MTQPGPTPNPAIDHAAFRQAKHFIGSDIQREIQLAQLNTPAPLHPRLNTGGGNLLAALGLLCFTEFGGKLRFNHKKPNNSQWDDSGRNFSDFFDLLGTDYADFRRSLPNGQDVYRIFRCGLAHEYYVKNHCTVYMLSGGHACGIGFDQSANRYFIVVETYFIHLMSALDRLEAHLFPGVSAGPAQVW